MLLRTFSVKGQFPVHLTQSLSPFTAVARGQVFEEFRRRSHHFEIFVVLQNLDVVRGRLDVIVDQGLLKEFGNFVLLSEIVHRAEKKVEKST